MVDGLGGEFGTILLQLSRQREEERLFILPIARVRAPRYSRKASAFVPFTAPDQNEGWTLPITEGVELVSVPAVLRTSVQQLQGAAFR